MEPLKASHGITHFTINETSNGYKQARFERIHRNHQVFIDAIEQYDSEKLREAFHLNFDDVGKDIEGFWLR